MSEIPLRSLRRNKSRAGYSKLTNNEAASSTSSFPEMPTHSRVIAAASRATQRKQTNGRGRKKDHYSDDIEEEARLLDNAYGEDEGDGIDNGRGIHIPATSQPVRFGVCANISFNVHARSRVAALPQRKVKREKKSLERYHSARQVRQGSVSHGLMISLFGSIDKLQSGFPPNIVRNQKYNAFTFLPIVFYEQFKFFFNLYFLLVALSQFVPALKIGKV